MGGCFGSDQYTPDNHYIGLRERKTVQFMEDTQTAQGMLRGTLMCIDRLWPDLILACAHSRFSQLFRVSLLRPIFGHLWLAHFLD